MSGKLPALSWQLMVKVFEADGFVKKREESSHLSFMKPGCLRPVIIPKYREIDVEILQNNMRTAGMSRERVWQLHDQVK